MKTVLLIAWTSGIFSYIALLIVAWADSFRFGAAMTCATAMLVIGWHWIITGRFWPSDDPPRTNASME